MDRLGIESWLKLNNIKNYTVNEDLSVDVAGDVSLLELNIVELPVKFRTVSGNFTCSQNKLISLVGCPSSVGGDFLCSVNRLTTLEFCPVQVGSSFNCDNNNVENYTINDDLSVDVAGDVTLRRKDLSSIPVRFGIVVGSFV